MVNLVNTLQSTVGLSAEQSKQVVSCLKTYLSDKMPSFMADSLDDVFEGKKVEVADLLKDKAGNITEEAKSAFNSLAEKAGDITEEITEQMEKVIHKVSDAFTGDKDKNKG